MALEGEGAWSEEEEREPKWRVPPAWNTVDLERRAWGADPSFLRSRKQVSSAFSLHHLALLTMCVITFSISWVGEEKAISAPIVACG